MRWSSFKYLFRQGLHSMLANRMMTLASLGVLLVCMLLTGFTGLLSANVNSLMEWLGGENEMVVMLDRSATDTEYEVTGAQIRSIDGVAEAIYTSKQEALDQLSGDMGEYAYLFNELAGEENPLYAQYTVRVSDPARMEEIANEIRSLDCVEMVNSPDGLVKTFLNVQKWVQIISWGLVTVLGVVSAVVISNTIRLTVFARRKEINIMKFLGATNTFIRMPFFVDGMTGVMWAGLLAGAGRLPSGSAEGRGLFCRLGGSGDRRAAAGAGSVALGDRRLCSLWPGAGRHRNHHLHAPLSRCVIPGGKL